jgi:hypothetical protein
MQEHPHCPARGHQEEKFRAAGSHEKPQRKDGMKFCSTIALFDITFTPFITKTSINHPPCAEIGERVISSL